MRPPSAAPPNPLKRRNPRGGAGSADTEQQASANPTIFRVVAIKPNGRRVVCGTCPTREAAEDWAALIRKYARIAGGSACVEADGGER
jgi:hypothetical protein